MKPKTAHIFIIVTMLLFLGCSSETTAPSRSGNQYNPEQTVQAERTMIARFHEAVGTVQARTDTRVEAQVTGRVSKVLVRPGDKVSPGDELIVLDSRASQTRLERARQAQQTATSMRAQARDFLDAAKAEFDKSKSTYRRMSQLHEQKVVTAEEVEKAESAYLQAKARLSQAQEGVAAAKARVGEAEKVVQEAEIGLGYTTIIAQESGEVARRMVEPGDLAFPGKELLTLQTGASLRLEAMVRESLIGKVRHGDTFDVIIAALGESPSIQAVVDEIEPLADPVTRSFLVKARLPEVPGLYPGMFGRLRIPLGEHETVLVPTEAIRRVGQLDTVMVKSHRGWHSTYVRAGDVYGEKTEILAGLEGDETIGIGRSEEAAQ
ncbi:MAG: efflux transporter periplasmic adaptor subunit [Desulfovibrio sp.]|nr:efflux transporter periplasmic adaptor subunit [Desulfovibrio sp.]